MSSRAYRVFYSFNESKPYATLSMQFCDMMKNAILRRNTMKFSGQVENAINIQ